MTGLVLVVPADLDRPTGGNRYDRSLAEALRSQQVEVEERAAVGAWPVGSAADQDGLAALLRDHRPVLVDGLLACGAPDAVASATAGGGRVHVLVHMPLAWRPDLTADQADRLDRLERHSLHGASGVISTSRWTAADLRRRHALPGVAVALPGTDPAPVAIGSSPPRLLQLAAVSPVKDQLTVVAALGAVRDLAWTADLTGPLDVDPGYTALVRAAIDSAGLSGRVRLTGPVVGPELDRVWAGTDLLLLPSRVEAWGLAVTEALARGIPAVVSADTGAAEALGAGGPAAGRDPALPGRLVGSGDPRALADAIRGLLGEAGPAARQAALHRRDRLRRWTDTATDVLREVS